MNLTEEEVVRKLVELQEIDRISNKYTKHLFLYDLVPLMIFRPSLWNRGILLSFMDSNWETMDPEYKRDIDKIFMERLIEIIADPLALNWYSANPLKLIDEVINYLNETKNYTFVTVEEDMTDTQAEVFKTTLLQDYFYNVVERFHLLTHQVFRQHNIVKMLIYQHDNKDETPPDYALCLKNINIEISPDSLVANLFVYEMVRSDLC